MTAKSGADRVADHRRARAARGEKEIRVWVPDSPEAVRRVQDLAAHLCAMQETRKIEIELPDDPETIRKVQEFAASLRVKKDP